MSEWMDGWLYFTCSGQGQHWVHLQKWFRSWGLCCLSAFCKNIYICCEKEPLNLNNRHLLLLSTIVHWLGTEVLLAAQSPKVYIHVCAHARQLLTYSAAVSSVCAPSGTSFSNHISSWMTATASLTYTARSVTEGQRLMHSHSKVQSRGAINTGQILVLWWVCTDDLHVRPARSSAPSHLSLLWSSTRESRSLSWTCPAWCQMTERIVVKTHTVYIEQI